ncbi:MAG: ABC transporter substrate-binding protein [Bacteroidales bacterium]|nr:ABC transporter substrate-binding protein [Bacteroidales bacterium]
MNHRLTAIILALSLALPLRSQTTAEEPLVFTPQWTAQAQFAGYYVALEKGFYADEGLNVVLDHPNASRSALERVRNNQSQVTTLPLPQAIEALDQGMDLVNILQTSMNSSLMIVSRRGVNPASQKGARVASFRAGYSQLAKAAAQEMGLEFEWLETAGMLNLFIAGAVDASLAMSYNEYFQFLQTGLIERDQSIVLRFRDIGYNIQEDGLYMTRKEFQKNPERALKFARASQKGWEWAAYHPEEAMEIVMKQVRKNHIATNPTLQRLMLQEILDSMEDFETGEREYLLREDMFDAVESLMLRNGITGKPHTVKELLP